MDIARLEDVLTPLVDRRQRMMTSVSQTRSWQGTSLRRSAPPYSCGVIVTSIGRNCRMQDRDTVTTLG